MWPSWSPGSASALQNAVSACLTPTSSAALLLPHYCFLVEKGKSKLGGKADRLITFDLMERRMSSYKKDTLQKEFDLGDIASVVGDTGGKLDLVVNFKENSPCAR